MTSLTRSCVGLVHAHEVTVEHAKTDNTPPRGQAKQSQLVRDASRLVMSSIVPKSEPSCASVVAKTRIVDTPVDVSNCACHCRCRSTGSDVAAHRRSIGWTAEAGRYCTLCKTTTCTDLPCSNRSKYRGGHVRKIQSTARRSCGMISGSENVVTTESRDANRSTAPRSAKTCPRLSDTTRHSSRCATRRKPRRQAGKSKHTCARRDHSSTGHQRTCDSHP